VRKLAKYATLGAGVALVTGCSDNPTALDDLNPQVEFEIEADRVETYEEVEIHVHIQESGMHLEMLESHLEIEHHSSGLTQTVELKPEGDGYAAHVMFFEPGEHHVQFSGRPRGHQLTRAMGEIEIDAARHHQVIGPYWVEIEMSPGRVLPGEEAHIHLHAFTIGADGMPDQPAAGLDMEVEVHDLAGGESALTVLEEEAGEYEVEYLFGDAGTYEMHVEIDVSGLLEDGEFHLPILSEEEDSDDDDNTGGGHGH
jgi:hypothetical protein